MHRIALLVMSGLAVDPIVIPGGGSEGISFPGKESVKTDPAQYIKSLRPERPVSQGEFMRTIYI